MLNRLHDDGSDATWSFRNAIFSDDGCNVFIDGKIVHEKLKDPQHLPTLKQSFFVIKKTLTSPDPFKFNVGQVYVIKVEYSNIIHPNSKDIDGCALFAYLGGGSVIKIEITPKPEEQIVSIGDEVSINFKQELIPKNNEVLSEVDEFKQTTVLNFGGTVNGTQTGRITQVKVENKIFTDTGKQGGIEVEFTENRQSVTITKEDQNISAKKALIKKVGVSGAFSETGTHPVSISTTVAFQNFSLTGSAVAQVQAVKFEIVITEILNGRKNKVGDFSQETPDNPMRIFVDTREDWDGKQLKKSHYDKQRVKITVRITPDKIPISRGYVRWELRDPDDPSHHVDIDPNDGGKSTPASKTQGKKKKGGDNTGKEHEKAEHWFVSIKDKSAPLFKPRLGNPIDREKGDEKTVIGEARTVIQKKDGKNFSSIFFNFSDDGGDNFIVKAILVDTRGTPDKLEDDKDHDNDSSKTLTVWRKRKMVAHAMASDGTRGVFDAFPATNRYTALSDAFGTTDLRRADENCYIDVVSADAEGDGRIGTKRERYRLARTDRLRIVQDGNNRDITFPAVTLPATAAEVFDRFTATGVLNAQRVDTNNRRIIVDYARTLSLQDLNGTPTARLWASNPPGELTAFRLLNPSRNFFSKNYPLFNTRYHTNISGPNRDVGSHPDATLQVISSANRFKQFGKSIGPHSYIGVQFINILRVAASSAAFRFNEFPITAGDQLIINTNRGETKVTFADRRVFNGKAPIADVVNAINAARGIAEVTAIKLEDVNRIRLRGSRAVTEITITNVGIPFNLGFPTSRATRSNFHLVVAIHEVGHTMINQSEFDYHTDHTIGLKCVAYPDFTQSVIFCPKHARRMRNNIARSYRANHVKGFD